MIVCTLLANETSRGFPARSSPSEADVGDQLMLRSSSSHFHNVADGRLIRKIFRENSRPLIVADNATRDSEQCNQVSRDSTAAASY